MKSRRHSEEENIFSANDQYTYNVMLKLPDVRKLKSLKKQSANQPNELNEEAKSQKRSRSVPYNVCGKVSDTRHSRPLRFSLDVEKEKTHLIEGKIKVAREVR